MLTYARLLWVHLRLWKWLRSADPFFHDVSGLPKVASRETFLLDLARARRVLHFGFADDPFTRERVANGALLHLRLRGVAESCFGVDISEDAIRVYRELTDDTDNEVLDIEEPDADLAPYSSMFDLILFGETLEHLGAPLQALVNLRKVCERNVGSRLCITVPNAFAASGFIAAMQGREIVHPDHYAYFSPVTVKTLLTRAGFEDIQISLYGSPATRFAPGITASGMIALCRPAS